MSLDDDHDEGADDALDARDDDVARLRAVNQRLVHAGVCADEAADLRERLIGILAHDLRGPLGTMIMSAEAMLERGQLGAADARLAQRALCSGHRMARMITQLLDFTRARQGNGFELTLAKGDLGSVCHDIAEELRIARSCDVRELVSGDLGGTWDMDRLAEVIANLAGNAVDHATPGSAVVIDARGEPGEVVVEITNQGRCIPADVIPTLFEPFRRASTETAARSGHLGLGLYIACEIVRAHGGALQVHSAGGATTFTVRLPRAVAVSLTG